MVMPVRQRDFFFMCVRLVVKFCYFQNAEAFYLYNEKGKLEVSL